MLSDTDITHALDRGALVIEPFDVDRLQPNSYDLTLSTSFVFLEPHHPLDLTEDNSHIFKTRYMDRVSLNPGQMVLGSTIEHVDLSQGLAARIEGKSSLGRLGLLVHTTAGFIDAGFSGQITLELVNLLKVPVTLHSGMPIAQISLFNLHTPSSRPYNGKYQHQHGATASKYHLNFHANVHRLHDYATDGHDPATGE